MAKRRRKGAEWIPDPEAVELLLESDPMQQVLMNNARKAADYIASIAPYKSGDLSRSYSAEILPVAGKLTVVLQSSSPMWHWFEYGSVKTPARRLFARGVASVRVPYTPKPKGGRR